MSNDSLTEALTALISAHDAVLATPGGGKALKLLRERGMIANTIPAIVEEVTWPRLRWCGETALTSTSISGPRMIAPWQEIPPGFLPANAIRAHLKTGRVKDFTATPDAPGPDDLVKDSAP